MESRNILVAICALCVFGIVFSFLKENSYEYKIKLIDQTKVEITNSEGVFIVHPDSIHSFIENDNL